MDAQPKGRKRIHPVAYVILLAFAVRAALLLVVAANVADPRAHHTPDSASYIKLAEGLSTTGRFARGGAPEIMRTPGYPLLLVPGIRTAKLETITIALQIALSCLTVYLVFRIALLLFGGARVATLCALLYALEPLSIVYSGLILTETLFTCAMAVFLYFLLKYLASNGLGSLLVSAVALAGSVYVRPVSYFLPVLIGFGLLLRAALASPKSRKLLVHACVFFVVSMGLVAAWQVRNAVRTGYRGFSAVTDLNLYFYQGASVVAAEQNSSYYKVQKEMGYGNETAYLKRHPEQKDWSPRQRYRYLRRQGGQILHSHPGTYATIHAKGMARTLLDPGAFEYLKLFKLYPQSGGLLGTVVDKGIRTTVADLYKNKPTVFWTNLALGLILGGYLLFGAVALLSRLVFWNAGVLISVAVGLYLLLLSGGPHAVGRFRHPVMPIICILAGAGLALTWARLRKKA